MGGHPSILHDYFCYESENDDEEILKKFISGRQNMIELCQREIELYEQDKDYCRQEIETAKKQFNHNRKSAVSKMKEGYIDE